MKNFILVFFMFSSVLTSSQKKESEKIKLIPTINNYLLQTIKAQEIPGLAVGVIKYGKIIFEAYYGKETIEENIPVSKNSLFRIYSTSKLISTVGIFQLIEKGKLSLEDNISKYIDSLPKEWQQVKIKNLLTHSSGIPDIIRYNDISVMASDGEKIKRLSKEKMVFETGDHFSYSQTNYWLLTMIIEKITGQTFEDYIFKNQFPDSNGTILFSSNSAEKIPNRVQRNVYDLKNRRYENTYSVDDGYRAHSGNGAAITLQAFLDWSNRLDNNIFINSETKKIMWTPFDFTNKKDRFAYGWEITKVNNHDSYGFSGGNVSAYRNFANHNLSIIVLSNGYKYYPVQDEIINHIAGLVDKNLIDGYSLSNELIFSEFIKINNQNAEEKYKAIKNKNPHWNFERTLNSIGYTLLRSDRLNDAIEVFELNVKENPSSANVYDSRGEAYFDKKDYQASKADYKKVLELEPTNQNAKEMLLKIENILKK
ncbi:serine hydrolase [Empedobacter brevis]|uniref:serine hydrolase n=1 Tax=Empedobacter brevis TaxID=247 RepID=UPI001320173E|nr:serine hydrolase [Empedobacter brevis]QHC84142.1 serine hydrolase [Empedobacter brevis]